VYNAKLAFGITRSFLVRVKEVESELLRTLQTGSLDYITEDSAGGSEILKRAAVILFKQLARSTAHAQAFITSFIEEERDLASQVDTEHASEYLLGEVEQLVEEAEHRGMLGHHELEQIVDHVLQRRRTLSSQYNGLNSSETLKRDVMMTSSVGHVSSPAFLNLPKDDRHRLMELLIPDSAPKMQNITLDEDMGLIVLRGRVKATYHPQELEDSEEEQDSTPTMTRGRSGTLQRVVLYESAGPGHLLAASQLMGGQSATLCTALRLQATTSVEFIRVPRHSVAHLMEEYAAFRDELWCTAAKEVMRMMPQLAFEIRLTQMITASMIKHFDVEDGNEDNLHGALLLRGSVTVVKSKTTLIAPAVVPAGDMRIATDDVVVYLFPVAFDLDMAAGSWKLVNQRLSNTSNQQEDIALDQIVSENNVMSEENPLSAPISHPTGATRKGKRQSTTNGDVPLEDFSMKVSSEPKLSTLQI